MCAFKYLFQLKKCAHQIKETFLTRYEIEKVLSAVKRDGDVKKWLTLKGLQPKQFVCCEKFNAYVCILMHHEEGNYESHYFPTRLGGPEYAEKLQELKAKGS
jgi:hypothetical protein